METFHGSPRHRFLIHRWGAQHGAVAGMSARARARDAKKHKVPFASIHQDVLLDMAIEMSGAALRIFWLANAAWVPTKTLAGVGVVRGRAILAISRLRNPLGLERGNSSITMPGSDAVREGIADCVEAGLMTRLSSGTRPGGPGGVAGKAAEYDLPHRHSVDVPPVVMPPNVRRPTGKVRQTGSLIRATMAHLADPAIRVFTYAVSFRDRSGTGEVEDAASFPLPVRRLAELLHMPRSTISDAIARLVGRKLLLVDQPSSGRRPTTYRLALRWNSFSKTGPD
jgi:hypothetical protein